LLTTMRPQPRSKLFPYTTLFRSERYGGNGPELYQVGCSAEDARGVTDEHPARVQRGDHPAERADARRFGYRAPEGRGQDTERSRSEEHTSELQSRGQLVCRLLLG